MPPRIVKHWCPGINTTAVPSPAGCPPLEARARSTHDRFTTPRPHLDNDFDTNLQRQHKKSPAADSARALHSTIPQRDLLHEEVRWSAECVVRVLVLCWWLIRVGIRQITWHIVCVKVPMHRMERKIHTLTTVTARSALTFHGNSSGSKPAVTHGTVVSLTTVATAPRTAWALRSHGWRRRSTSGEPQSNHPRKHEH